MSCVLTSTNLFVRFLFSTMRKATQYPYGFKSLWYSRKGFLSTQFPVPKFFSSTSLTSTQCQAFVFRCVSYSSIFTSICLFLSSSSAAKAMSIGLCIDLSITSMDRGSPSFFAKDSILGLAALMSFFTTANEIMVNKPKCKIVTKACNWKPNMEQDIYCKPLQYSSSLLFQVCFSHLRFYYALKK